MASDREKMVAELDNVLVFVTDQKISDINAMLPILNHVVEAHAPMLLIAEDFDADVLATLTLNKMRGALNVVAVKAPEFGDAQKAALEDIAILTGANLITKDLGREIKDATPDDLGRVKKAVVRKDRTALIGGEGDKEALEAHVNELRAQMDQTTSDYDKKNLAKRIAKLSSGVAVLKVGAMTESQLKEKKLRIEDALNATKAAVAEGIVVGGGAALAEAYKALKGTLKDPNRDIQMGINAVLESLLEPVRQIATNAGYEASDIVEEQRKAKKGFGFNAESGTWVDLFEAGIVDPTKVTRSAVLNASSIAALFVTTEGAVTEIKEEKPAAPGNPDMY